MYLFVSGISRLSRFFKFLAGALVCLCQPFLLVEAQSVSYPAEGIYNGFLSQTNILECDNNNPESLAGSIGLFSGSGELLATQAFSLEAFGSAHIILNDLANIADSYGTFTVSLTGDTSLGDRVSCRTVFYKSSPESAEKDFDFAYVIPVSNPSRGSLSGIFNSINPSSLRTPVQNWLSIVNSSNSQFQGRVEIYGAGGELRETISLQPLEPKARVDIPLGHQEGEVSGIYRIVPEDTGQDYQSMLIRYGAHREAGRFSFAFPMKSLPGTCQGSRLFASTMASPFTQNWLELANPGEEAVDVGVVVKDRFGGILSNETIAIPARQQSHVYLNAIIGSPNVGTVEIECVNPSVDSILAQTAYYGSNDSANSSWAYAVQSEAGQTAIAGSQLSFPLNTFIGMGNWIKIAEEDNSQSSLRFSLFDSQGNVRASSEVGIAGSGTVDFDVHSKVAPNIVGSTIVSSSDGSGISGHVLRTLPDKSGGIGSIVYIPGSIQPFSEIPETNEFSGNAQSLAPYRDFLSDAEINHFYTRTSFGASRTERANLKNIGLRAEVSRLINAPLNPSINTYIEDPSGVQWNETKVAWMRMMIDGSNPLHEKMALIFHDLFATSCRASNGNENCRDHVELLRRNSLGNFRDLAQEITIDHTMLNWLNGSANTAESPDENYSREFWELFTMGEASLHDGEWRLYDSQDIRESSRSFTGWRTWFPDGRPAGFNADYHDFGQKTIWAGTPYEVTGAFNQADMVNLTLDIRPESAEWIAKRLFSALVHDHPSDEVVRQLANQIVATNWEIKPVLQTILQSEAFFSEDAKGNRVKDAITYLVGFLRTTEAYYRYDRFSWAFTHQSVGFEPTRPLSVNGWPINKFEGASKSSYFLSWLTGYANIMNSHLSDIMGEESTFDPLSLIPTARFNPTAPGVVDELTALMGVQLSVSERAMLIEYVSTDVTYSGDVRVTDLLGNEGALRTKITGVLWMLGQHRDYLTF